jgi:secreted trypsin-like serine protease
MKTQILKRTLLATCIAVAATSSPSQAGSTSPQRIIGGIETSSGNYPWIVSVQSSDGSHFCGASLIDKQWVMTAAHCVPATAASDI